MMRRLLWVAILSIMAWDCAWGMEVSRERPLEEQRGQRRKRVKNSALPPSGSAEPIRVSQGRHAPSEELWELPIEDPFVLASGSWYTNPQNFRRLTELAQADNPMAKYYLARGLEELGDSATATDIKEKATQGFLEASQSSSSSLKKAVALWYLDLLYIQRGGRKEAKRVTQEVSESTTAVSTLLWQAYVSKMDRDYATAEEALRKVGHKDYKALLHKANLYLAIGKSRDNDAIEACVQAIQHEIPGAYELLYDMVTKFDVSFEDVRLKVNEILETTPIKAPEDLLIRAASAEAYQGLALVHRNKKPQTISHEDAEAAARYYALSGEKGLPQNYREAAEFYTLLGDSEAAAEYNSRFQKYVDEEQAVLDESNIDALRKSVLGDR